MNLRLPGCTAPGDKSPGYSHVPLRDKPELLRPTFIGIRWFTIFKTAVWYNGLGSNKFSPYLSIRRLASNSDISRTG
jgi:hypothetical protein